MAKKKGKVREGNAEIGTVTAPSEDIFKTLFGRDLTDNTVAPSIFSDDNPFKRKPIDSKPTTRDYPSNFESENYPKERKNPTEEERSNLEEENPLKPTSDYKRSKILKTLIVNSGSELGESLKEENGKKKEKIKKKRKRDEVEKEYKARKYAAILEEDKGEEKVGAVKVGGKRKKMDEEVVEKMVSKHGDDEEGFDDEEKLLRTVFVGNLPLKVKKKAIVKEFSRFGEIDSVRIRSIPIVDTKIPRKGAILLKKFNDTADSVHAYIVFKTKESAECALAHNMAMVGGNHIRVDRACPPCKKLKVDSSPLYDSKRTVFLGNLPFDVKDEEIYQLFSGIKDLESSLEGVRVIRDPHIGLGKGIAYVLFRTREAANLACKRRRLVIRDRELRISHAKQNSTPSKRANPFSSDTDNSPAKKLAIDSRAADRSSRPSTRGAMPYQGLRSNKADGQKRGHLKNRPVEKKSNAQPGEKQKEKRPAVAARKAKAKVLKEIGASKQAAGKKRKLDSQTPDSLNRKLKTKRFRLGNY